MDSESPGAFWACLGLYRDSSILLGGGVVKREHRLGYLVIDHGVRFPVGQEAFLSKTFVAAARLMDTGGSVRGRDSLSSAESIFIRLVHHCSTVGTRSHYTCGSRHTC